MIDLKKLEQKIIEEIEWRKEWEFPIVRESIAETIILEYELNIDDEILMDQILDIIDSCI